LAVYAGKEKLYIVNAVLTPIGERRVMLHNKIRYPNNKQFGELELVDKEVFYICPNRRDN